MRRLLCPAAVVLIAAGVARAQEAPPPVALPDTELRVMQAPGDGGAYRLFIAKPQGPIPAGGYPVLYVLDANAMFATVAETVRMQSRRPEATGVGPAVIVGIGYPTDEPFDAARRFYDYTPPGALKVPLPRPGGAPPPKTGGGDRFLEFIESQVKPAIEASFKIDRGRQAIFGHSLGGLFVLYAMFTRPAAFQTYIAGSPSIWWNGRQILELERGFGGRVPDGGALRLLVVAGEFEQTPSPLMLRQPNAAQRVARQAENRMVDNAREMVARLAAARVKAAFVEFKGENHASIVPLALHRAVRFALEGEP